MLYFQIFIEDLTILEYEVWIITILWLIFTPEIILTPEAVNKNIVNNVLEQFYTIDRINYLCWLGQCSARQSDSFVFTQSHILIYVYIFVSILHLYIFNNLR